jgi:hypothetical protein
MSKNITLNADEKLIKRARDKARREKTTLNERFRQWLQRYVNSNDVATDYEQLMTKFSYTKVGGRFNRDAMNER